LTKGKKEEEFGGICKRKRRSNLVGPTPKSHGCTQNEELADWIPPTPIPPFWPTHFFSFLLRPIPSFLVPMSKSTWMNEKQIYLYESLAKSE
jgi:hypothetical protein